jgi:hypothetical protein
MMRFSTEKNKKGQFQTNKQNILTKQTKPFIIALQTQTEEEE